MVEAVKQRAQIVLAWLSGRAAAREIVLTPA
jgi:hypothetical protein